MESLELNIENDLLQNLNTFYPAIGFGTYPMQGNTCTQAVKTAYEKGYRIFDTATYYENFESIAKALETKDRKSYYLISKVWHDMVSQRNLKRDLENTLRKLQIEYLDAYLIHWPNHQIPIEETLGAMDELRKENKIIHLGLSNVNVNHLRKALEVGVPISWVQVEMHPFFLDQSLLEFCKKEKIILQAWRPLNLGRVKEDPLLIEIGKNHKKSASQISLRWNLQNGCLPLPSSKNEKHIQDNFSIFDFSLSSDEMKTLNERAIRGQRVRITKEDGLGFCDEFDFSYNDCWP